MSLFEMTVPGLSLKPWIHLEEGRLEVRTSPLLRALSLFSWCHTVEVDTRRRSIRIRTRRFWRQAQEREIPFDRIEYIDYSLDAIPTGWSAYGATDQVESFTISLVCREPRERVPFATFSGEGSVSTGWGGMLIGGDEMVDVQGDQESASRRLVEVLRRMVGVSVGSPVPHISDGQGRRYRCTACGRNCPPTKSRCIYCGKPVEVVPPSDGAPGRS